MCLRFCGKVWTELIKEILQDGFKTHAKDLLNDGLVAIFIINGSLSREVSCCAKINWAIVRPFLEDAGSNLVDRDSAEVSRVVERDKKIDNVCTIRYVNAGLR